METKAKLFENLSWKGAYTFQTNRDEQNQNNLTQMPNHIAKIGLSYDATTDWQISAFDSYFSDAKVLPSSLMVNPNARSYHNLSVNTNYRLDNWLGLSLGEHVTLSLYLDNLLDEKFYYPEFEFVFYDYNFEKINFFSLKKKKKYSMILIFLLLFTFFI